ncbi:hypothetical protein BS47DRAFT_946164 [Hydnum rufescens UP504]|uniref:Uncharacterized protein n=1 Tax=Hydnum rufescens UP504 TaxID=1448309 RepID=A0A9P6DWI5_9AGAM|nr:hypothetical protein BS47DRAFT_946164 [Hydnum rufescens UP504]
MANGSHFMVSTEHLPFESNLWPLERQSVKVYSPSTARIRAPERTKTQCRMRSSPATEKYDRSSDKVAQDFGIPYRGLKRAKSASEREMDLEREDTDHRQRACITAIKKIRCRANNAKYVIYINTLSTQLLATEVLTHVSVSNAFSGYLHQNTLRMALLGWLGCVCVHYCNYLARCHLSGNS